MDFPALADFVKKNDIGLSIIGPEAPLVAGITDYFQKQDLLCFGPSQGAAQLEAQKLLVKISATSQYSNCSLSKNFY